jgi:hypothetical protein
VAEQSGSVVIADVLDQLADALAAGLTERGLAALTCHLDRDHIPARAALF